MGSKPEQRSLKEKKKFYERQAEGPERIPPSPKKKQVIEESVVGTEGGEQGPSMAWVLGFLEKAKVEGVTLIQVEGHIDLDSSVWEGNLAVLKVKWEVLAKSNVKYLLETRGGSALKVEIGEPTRVQRKLSLTEAGIYKFTWRLVGYKVE